MTFHPIEDVNKLHDDFRKAVKINGESILLIQFKGQVYLLERLCPHSAYPMDEGVLVDAALRCPMHGYLFDIPTGNCTLSTEGPCRGLKTYEPVFRDGMVGVELAGS